MFIKNILFSIGLCLLLCNLAIAQDLGDGDIPDEDVATLAPPSSLGIRGEDYSFAKSKYTLAKEVYRDYHTAFYSRCTFASNQKQLVLVKSSCTYQPRKNPTRGYRIEWEHIMPAWVFGHQLRCWQTGGRSNCRNTNAKFRQMEADMHNLVPASGEINGDRNNFGYRIISGEARLYGKNINMEIDFQAKAAEPPDEVFGDIARTYFYMRDRYDLKLSSNEESLFQIWNNADPVDKWEVQRNALITKLQGNDNPYVTRYQALQRETKQPTPTPTPAPDNSAGAGTSIPSVTTLNNLDALVEQAYQWVLNHKEQLPYPLVLVAMLAYFWYRKQKPAPRKVTRRR